MINLNDTSAPGGGGTAADLNFVSLSRDSPQGGMQPQLQATGEIDNYDFLGRWSDAILGVGDTLPEGTKRKSVLESKFDVNSLEVQSEVLEALSGGFRSRIPILAAFGARSGTTSNSANFGDPSDILSVGSQFVGDWWGPTWVSLTFTFALCLSRNVARLSSFSSSSSALASVDLSCPLSAFLTALFYVAGVTILLTTFCKSVVRDPTFFGSSVQRLKLFSIAGYSLTPLTIIVLLDSLTLGLLGVNRSGTLHGLLVFGTALAVAGLYVAKRFPLRVIGAYSSAFDPRKAQLAFWLGFSTIASLTTIFVQSFFV